MALKFPGVRLRAWRAALVGVAVAVLVVGLVGSLRSEPDQLPLTNERAGSVWAADPTSTTGDPSASADDLERPWMRRFTTGERPPQFVIFSFDGGGYADRWRLFLDTAKASQATFTVFMTGTYFVPEASRTDYTPPGNEPGKACLLYTSPSPRDRTRSRMPSSA